MRYQEAEHCGDGFVGEDSEEDAERVTRLTLWKSLRCASLKLWDKDRQELIGFRALREDALSKAGVGGGLRQGRPVLQGAFRSRILAAQR